MRAPAATFNQKGASPGAEGAPSQGVRNGPFRPALGHADGWRGTSGRVCPNLTEQPTPLSTARKESSGRGLLISAINELIRLPQFAAGTGCHRSAHNGDGRPTVQWQTESIECILSS